MDWLKDLIKKATQVITAPINIAKQSLASQNISTPQQFFDKAIVQPLKEFPSFIDTSLKSTIGKIPFIGKTISDITSTGTKAIYKGMEGYGEGYTGRLVDIPYPKSQNLLEKVGYGTGYTAGFLSGLPSKIAKAISPAIKPASQPLIQKGAELMGQGGLKSVVGRALANVGEGLPYTPTLSLIERGKELLGGEKPQLSKTPGELLQSTAFDVAVPMIPVVGGLVVSTKPLMKEIKSADELASTIAKEYKVGGGGGITKNLDEIVSSLKQKGYKLADEITQKLSEGGVLSGKKFSISSEKPMGQGKPIVDFIFDEGYKPTKGIKLKTKPELPKNEEQAIPGVLKEYISEKNSYQNIIDNAEKISKIKNKKTIERDDLAHAAFIGSDISDFTENIVKGHIPYEDYKSGKSIKEILQSKRINEIEEIRKVIKNANFNIEEKILGKDVKEKVLKHFDSLTNYTPQEDLNLTTEAKELLDKIKTTYSPSDINLNKLLETADKIRQINKNKQIGTDEIQEAFILKGDAQSYIDDIKKYISTASEEKIKEFKKFMMGEYGKRIEKIFNQPIRKQVEEIISNIGNKVKEGKITVEEGQAILGVLKEKPKIKIENTEEFSLPKKPQDIIEEATLPIEKPILPGKSVPLTPKQTISIFKKTGEAYPFVNILPSSKEAIQLPADYSELKNIVSGKDGTMFDISNIKTNKDLISGGSDGLFGEVKRIGNKVKEFFEHPRRIIEQLGEEARKFTVDYHATKMGITKAEFDNYRTALKDSFQKNKITKDDYINAVNFLENKIDEGTLQQASKNWQGIKNFANDVRIILDKALERINEERRSLGLEEVGRLEGYFPHIIETIKKEKLSIENLLGEKYDKIIGNAPFFRFGQKRTGAEGYSFDLPKVLETYLYAAERQVALPSIIERYKTLAEATNKAGLPEYTKYLLDKARYIQEGIDDFSKAIYNSPLLGTLARTINRVTNKTSLNLVAQNLSASLSNPTQIHTLQVAEIGVDNVAKGYNRTIKNINPEIEAMSSFLQNRKQNVEINPNKIKEGLNTINMFKITQELTDRVAFNSYLEYALSKGMDLKQAVAFADDASAKLVGERTFGLMPKAQEISVFRPLTMFTLEVINALNAFFKDIPQFKNSASSIALAYGTYMVLANVYNHIMERITGRRYAFDPTDMIVNTIDIWANKPYTTEEKIGATGKVITRNIPLTDVLFGRGNYFLPMSAGIPSKEELKANPLKAAAKFGLIYLNPYGGGYQAYKTMEGLEALSKGYVETPKGDIRYLVERNLENYLKAALFGKASTKEAREFYSEQRKPIEGVRAFALKQVQDDKERKRIYENLMFYRAVTGEATNIRNKISEAILQGKSKEEVNQIVSDLKDQTKKNLAYYTSYLNQPKGVYQRVLGFLLKLIGVHQKEEEKKIKKDLATTVPVESTDFKGIDISKILGAGGLTGGGGGVRLSAKSVPKLNIPKVSWAKGIKIKTPTSSKISGGVKLSPPPSKTIQEKGRAIAKELKRRRGVRLRNTR